LENFYMKKTLVAIAVLAASGASFAQVSITGNYKFGYKSTTNVLGVNGADSSGFGIDTSYVQFTANEDLGGGLKAVANMSIDGLNRAKVAGGDSQISIEGGFGKFRMYTERGPDTMTDYVKGSVGMDEKVFSAITASDGIAYLTPELFPGFKIQIQHVETAPSQAGENVSPIGLGVGAAGAQVAQRRNDIRFQYASGPLAAAVNFLSYDQQGDATLYPKATTTATRGYARYDFGVARVGAALYQLNYNKGSRTDSMIALNAPVGSFDLGAEWAQRKIDDTTGTNGTTSGYALSAQYNLSKRTAVVGTYSRWDVLNKETVSETAILLTHAF
jgi:hypothetical protein